MNLFATQVAAPEADAGLDDIAPLFNALVESRADGNFVVFMPSLPREGEEAVLNIQLSIEEGVVGLDWVLISPVNNAEKQTFLDICHRHSVEVSERFENGCRFLRVEDGDLVSLCRESICSLYPELSGKSLNLVLNGVDWPSAHR